MNQNQAKYKLADKDILYHNDYLDLAEDTARYYGFKIVPMPPITKEIKGIAESVLKEDDIEESPCLPILFLEEKVAILKWIEEKALPKDQVHSLAFSSRLAKKNKDRKLLLAIVGTNKNIAEAMIIHTVMEILREEESDEELTLKINHMGDKETISRYFRELQSFWKKNIDELTSSCKDAVRRNPIYPLCCGHEKCQKVVESAPKPIAFLSESQRMNFMEVLEYLESIDIPYEIDEKLIGCRAWASQVVFSVVDKNKTPVAAGIRYNQLSRKIGWKKDLPVFGAKIVLPSSKNIKLIKNKAVKPKVCFVQLGLEAKHKSLNVLRVLRKAKIPVYQAISKDKIGAQLAMADNLKIPYVIIMGQKEAITNTVIVRNNENKSQETVPLTELVSFIKSADKLLSINTERNKQ